MSSSTIRPTDYLTREQVEQRAKALLVTCCYQEARDRHPLLLPGRPST